MDSVRFGRVLGKGARAAAKGLYEAVDAATAANPGASRSQQPPPAGEPLRAAVEAVAQGHAAYREQKKAVTREAGKLGKSFLTPFARAGHTLFLEVMGSFFVLFGVIFLTSMWKFRGAIHLNAVDADAHRRFWGSVAGAAIFIYFAVTSFVRARRRERRA